ncbi:MAG: efflux RND transporter periplasmic adaptor subunit [Anaerolineae bacterium]|nr:efflux RND transporter periplasmic adaptor subunit [Anaerolineae bacterium]
MGIEGIQKTIGTHRPAFVKGIGALMLVALIVAGVVYATSPRLRAQALQSAGIEAGAAPGDLFLSGFIEAETVDLAAEIGGRVTDLPFAEGEDVPVDAVVVQLDTSLLEAQLAAAQAQLAIAEAQRDQIAAGPRAEVIEQAEAQVQIAQAALDAARVALAASAAVRNNPQDIMVQLVDAETRLAVAQEQVGAAQAQLSIAEDAKITYEFMSQVHPDINVGGLAYAPKKYEEAFINLQSAQEAVSGAQALVAALQRLEANPQGLQAQVTQAQASIETATASLARAQSELERIRAGATPEDLAVADAGVAEVQAAADGILAQIDRLTLRAPISGAVLDTTVHAGELAVPGATLITIANLDTVDLTVYVTGPQLGDVFLGQEAIVTVNSFPGQTFSSEVVFIAAEAEFTPRSIQTREERVNLVYGVKLRIQNPDHLLKPGMPADALFTVRGGE